MAWLDPAGGAYDVAMRAMAATIVLIAACKGGGGGGGEWIAAKRTEVSGTVGGVAFTLQIPEGFVPDTGGPTGRVVGWENQADTVGFHVSAAERPVTSVEAAVEAGTLPQDHRTVEKQAAIADGFVVWRSSGKGVALANVYKNHPGGTLHCGGGATSGAEDFEDIRGVMAALEAVCSTLTVK